MRWVSKVLSALIIELIVVWAVYGDYLKWSRRGREAFLSYQAHRFDHYMAIPHIAGLFLGAIVLGFLFFGLYELLAAGIAKIVR